MPTGKVVFFNRKNKFGFIHSDEDGNNYYVHEKSLGGIIVEQDDLVEFELKDARRGKEAVQVKKISPSS